MAVYTLTSGADAFTMRETRDGLLRKTAVWTHADGVWTMGGKGQQLYFLIRGNYLIFASAAGGDSERMRGCGGEGG